MKTPEEITQDVLDGMIGIGGCPSNEEFYAEFDDRLRRALSIANVVGRSEQYFCCKDQINQRCSEQCLGCFQFQNQD